MNVYDLNNLATPGPFRVTSLAVGDIDILASDGRYVADLSGLEETNAKADAQLLTHCRNNFLKALEALKNMQDRYESLKCVKCCTTDCDGEDKCFAAERKLIAELEEVQE